MSPIPGILLLYSMLPKGSILFPRDRIASANNRLKPRTSSLNSVRRTEKRPIPKDLGWPTSNLIASEYHLDPAFSTYNSTLDNLHTAFTTLTSMAPPEATGTITATMPEAKVQQSTQAGGAETAKVKMQMPAMPKFEDKMEEREYLKGRLAAAFRIFGKYGYDEGTSAPAHNHHPHWIL